MIDIKLLRENPDKIKKAAVSKGADPLLVDNFLKVDKEWRELTQKIDELRAQQKKLSENRNVGEAKKVKEEIKTFEAALQDLEKKRDGALKYIPNPPLETVPAGKDAAENITLKEIGEKPVLAFKPKDYLSLAEALGIIDTERAGKVSGTRFGYLLGGAALLEFALVQLVSRTVTSQKILQAIIKKNGLDIDSKPFVPVVPPVLIKKEMMEGMGYVERGGEEMYLLEKDGLYLVGTSEQSMGPMHFGETFNEDDLPRRYLGFSTCFRREAGSYGKDTKGILRVHQFDKLEMFSFTKPEESIEEHKLLLAIEEYLMQQLDLPYRVLNICAGDLGDPAAAKYDIEAWLPGQNGGAGEYRETHSTSNTTDFQARRLRVKFKRKTGETEFVHMLNGTAFAIGRTIIAVLENYQQKDGSVKIPKALQPFMHGLKKIEK